MKTQYLLLLILSLLVSCAKEAPEEKVYKPKEILSLSESFESFDIASAEILPPNKLRSAFKPNFIGFLYVISRTEDNLSPNFA